MDFVLEGDELDQNGNYCVGCGCTKYPNLFLTIVEEDGELVHTLEDLETGKTPRLTNVVRQQLFEQTNIRRTKFLESRS